MWYWLQGGCRDVTGSKDGSGCRLYYATLKPID